MLNTNLVLSFSLMIIGLMGVFLNRNHLLGALMSVELILLGVNINLVLQGSLNNNPDTIVFALLVMAMAAAEAALGLSILIYYYKNYHRVSE